MTDEPVEGVVGAGAASPSSPGTGRLMRAYDDVMEPPTPVVPSREQFWIDKIGPERVRLLDRQIRLWGFRGQIEIDRANVLLLNASAVGCEVLKNLVLPGLASFCIWDHRTVTSRDLGTNFYLTVDDIGQLRAEAAAKCLCEMNEQSQGSYARVDVIQALTQNPRVVEGYNYVIATQIPCHLLEKLSRVCAELKVYLIIVRSYGMAGHVRISYQGSHCIIESKLDNPFEDLRLWHPWEDLMTFAEHVPLETMNDRDFSHTPWICLVVMGRKAWMAEHDGALPVTRDERRAFGEMIMTWNTRGEAFTNFSEALTNAYHAYVEKEVPDSVKEVLFNPCANPENLVEDTPMFWFYAAAARMFYENEGEGKMLPLPGGIPDMHSDTDRYVRLQSLYRRKHRKDLAAVAAHLKTLFEQSKRPMQDMPDDLGISFFLKHVYNLRVVNFRPFHLEMSPDTIQNDDIVPDFWNCQEKSAVMQYVGIRACDEFMVAKGKYPGENMDDDLDAEADELLPIMKRILVQDMKVDLSSTCVNDDLIRKYARAFTRYGGSEMHNISALLGGVAAQEVIKIVTKQRVPLNNTWIYSGLHSVSARLEL